MKIKTTAICHLDCGVVKPAGRAIDVPKKEAERHIAAGNAISLEEKEPKTETKVKPKKQ